MVIETEKSAAEKLIDKINEFRDLAAQEETRAEELRAQVKTIEQDLETKSAELKAENQKQFTKEQAQEKLESEIRKLSLKAEIDGIEARISTLNDQADMAEASADDYKSSANKLGERGLETPSSAFGGFLKLAAAFVLGGLAIPFAKDKWNQEAPSREPFAGKAEAAATNLYDSVKNSGYATDHRIVILHEESYSRKGEWRTEEGVIVEEKGKVVSEDPDFLDSILKAGKGGRTGTGPDR